MVSNTITLLSKAKNILHDEGAVALLRRTCACLSSVGLPIRYQVICVYEKNLDSIESPPLKLENFTLKVITSPEQIDQLLAEGFDLSYHSDMATHRQKLALGGIIFYGFAGKRLVHTNWIALAKEANFDPYPIGTDWPHEACLGPSFTMPEYRSMGINAFVYAEMFRFLQARGYTKARFTMARRNIEHRRSQAKIGSEVTGEYGLLRILRWTFWIEKPTRWIKI